MDFGYPQNLSPEILKLYITQEGVRSPFSSKPSDKPVPNATLQVTGAVGWRREGLVYKKNEVTLLDFVSIHITISARNSVLILVFFRFFWTLLKVLIFLCPPKVCSIWCFSLKSSFITPSFQLSVLALKALYVTLILLFIGSVLRCDVTGKILMKCFLSGMPDLKLGLNDKIGLEKESQLKSRPIKR
ncbi:hypothetical protein BHM03_00026603 [Ensete ventricosum]|uniref:MHD domain-containing protein n=1 Tax=Ensete ventricosum TaxID=4639 RepID=A0A427AY19_ENSVE|nr:hypothetical protein B296_00001500 [Ensete ventricosum]RZR97427.1 hypothetical protein BHM03_00026603 [Ensete ventricosum]